MTVEELIAKLTPLNPRLEVRVGYEGISRPVKEFVFGTWDPGRPNVTTYLIIEADEDGI